MWFYLIGTVIVGALLYKYLFSSSNRFWKKYGIREIDTSSAISKLDLMLARKPLTDKDDYACTQMGPNEKFCGLMDMGKPLLLVKDMELIKKVFIKDFDHFVDRRQFFHQEDAVLQKQLPTLEGDEWKGVRHSLSPTFTTGKIRKMMDIFNSVGKELVQEFQNQCKANGGSTNIKVMQAISRYTIDVISNTAFGMNANAIQNPNSEFAKHAMRLAELTTLQRIRFIVLLSFPLIRRITGIALFDTTNMKFFLPILEQGIKSRMNGEIHRNDFLQLLAEAKKGELKVAAEELESFEKDAQLQQGQWQKKQYLTDDVMKAQCLAFFFAGFGTTSNFITFAMYALALHKDVQQKLREEVGKIMKEDGSLDYDDVCQLVYLDMVTCEVLRKFPAVGRLERKCIREYKDPENNLVIPKDCLVGIPLNYIHNSKEYYERPEEFYPEHFTPEKKAARSPYAFMPFGMGPRNCIGMRFALIESKAAIAKLVHNFIIEPTATTPETLRGESLGFGLAPPKNLELKLTSIHSK